MDIVDFHTHLWPPEWAPGGKRARPSGAISPDIHRRIVDPNALLQEFNAAGVSLAVVSTTIESLFSVEGPVDRTVIRDVNDWLQALVSVHPQRLAAVATIDAFDGDSAAREAERAITELKLSGLVIDSSRRGLFLN